MNYFEFLKIIQIYVVVSIDLDGLNYINNDFPEKGEDPIIYIYDIGTGTYKLKEKIWTMILKVL
jgi:hypothetical protein